jgi:hypothetical protein
VEFSVPSEYNRYSLLQHDTPLVPSVLMVEGTIRNFHICTHHSPLLVSKSKSTRWVGPHRRGVRNANEIFVRKPYVKRLLGRRGIYPFINDLTLKRTDINNQLISWSRVHLNKFYEN